MVRELASIHTRRVDSLKVTIIAAAAQCEASLGGCRKGDKVTLPRCAANEGPVVLLISSHEDISSAVELPLVFACEPFSSLSAIFLREENFQLLSKCSE